MAEKFKITIPCKLYTRRFLELNFGCPVDFTRDNTIYPIFRAKLKRQSKKRDSYYASLSNSKYLTTVDIKILEDDFYRYGWELTYTDTVSFNREIEGRAKLFMYVFVSTRISFGMNLTDAVHYFQERFGFTEDIWQADSIIKDCQRNLTVQKNEIIENTTKMIDKLIMDILFEKRIICSPKKINSYDTI